MSSAIVPKTEQTDPTKSPYYLHPSDNPGSVITPVQLTEDNYAEWATNLENALRAKRKSGFLNGTLLQPTETEEEETWKTVNSMIVGWIRASISPKIRSTVSFTTDAHKLWCDLKKRFSVGNVVRVYQIKSELSSCRQEGSSVMEYFGRLSSKWEELLNYKPPPKCSCDAKDVYTKESEEEKVHQFLMGLDEAWFGNVCTNIIGMDPLADLNSVYQRVVREERRLVSTRVEQKQDVVGFVTRAEQSEASGALAAVVRTRDGSSLVLIVRELAMTKRTAGSLLGLPICGQKKTQEAVGLGEEEEHFREDEVADTKLVQMQSKPTQQ